MRVSIRRFALVLSLPALAGVPAYAQEAYYDDEYQPPAAIALFSSQNFQGDVREAFDPFASMHDLAFNDRARSVAVLAGQWELCEHSDFTGRCVFIREDVPDLGWFDLNGRVSSIRPIFEYTEAQHGLMFTRDGNGYIRYAHNQSYGYDTWNYGYSSSVRLSVQHYGYSPDYWRFGYYDPRWGYDPYGFAWRPVGGPRYVSYTYRVHPRPVIINTYWKSHWGKSHKHWDRRGHRDDWRRKPDWRGDPGRGPGRGKDGWDRDRDRGGRDGGWTGGGRGPGSDRGDGRGRDGWRGDGQRPDGPRTDGPRRDGPRADAPRTDGPRTGPGRPPRADSGVIPTDPRRGEGRGQGGWGNGNRDGGSAIVTPPRDDRGPRGDGRGAGRGDWRGDRDGSGRGAPGRGGEGGGRGGRDTGAVTPPSPPVAAPAPPSGRPDRGGSRGEGRGGEGRGRGGDGGLLGAPGGGGARPVADTPRRGGGGGEGGWRGDSGGRRGGGGASAPAPSVSPPPAPPPTAVSRPAPPPRVERGGRGGEGRGGGMRRGDGPRRDQD